MIGVVTCASALMPCALSSALVMGGCRGLGLNGAMVPLVLCRQCVCSPEQPLYSPPGGDATILSHEANPGRIEFLERSTLSTAGACCTADFGPANVRFGSRADAVSLRSHVRFTPESGQMTDIPVGPLCAKSGHNAVQQISTVAPAICSLL